jgi:hypothetical protein
VLLPLSLLGDAMDMIIDVDDEKIEILKLQSDCEKQ